MIDDTNKEDVQDDVVTDAGESTEDVTAEAAPASLSINDLTNLKQIVDIASQRGAFRADEFQVVGITYDRLVAFLTAVAPKSEIDATTNNDTAEA